MFSWEPRQYIARVAFHLGAISVWLALLLLLWFYVLPRVFPSWKNQANSLSQALPDNPISLLDPRLLPGTETVIQKHQSLTESTNSANTPAESQLATMQDHVNQIVTHLSDYYISEGRLPEEITQEWQQIGTGPDNVDLESQMVPEYTDAWYYHPQTGSAENTGYWIKLDANNTIKIQTSPGLSQ